MTTPRQRAYRLRSAILAKRLSLVWLKGMARRMELTGLAIRRARVEGLKGEAARARANDLLNNPTDDMIEKSFDYGRYVTFQRPLGDTMRHVSAFTQASMVGKFLVPFVRTPTNLLKFAMERSPAAPILGEWRKDMVAGGARRDQALARALVGTGVGAMFYQAALEGKITGGGPADREARRLMEADGWKPYSFKVGDRYYSYQRLDPFATTIGTMADMVDLGSVMTERQQEHSTALVVAAILNNLSSKTFMSGLSSATEALADPSRKIQGFLSRSAGSVVAPAGLAQLARTTDPILREARLPMDRIRSRIPGMSDDLMPRRDAFGRPLVSEGGIGPDIASPIWTGTAKNDPTIKALLEAGVHVTAPPRRVNKRDLTPDEYDTYAETTGRVLKPALDALVASPEWKPLTDEQKRDAVSDTVRDARKVGREALASRGSGAKADP